MKWPRVTCYYLLMYSITKDTLPVYVLWIFVGTPSIYEFFST